MANWGKEGVGGLYMITNQTVVLRYWFLKSNSSGLILESKPIPFFQPNGALVVRENKTSGYYTTSKVIQR